MILLCEHHIFIQKQQTVMNAAAAAAVVAVLQAEIAETLTETER
jgi:hypothetical protein